MFPRPIALGMTLCEKVIVEKGTENISLVSTFNKMSVRQLPSVPRPFAVFAMVTDGMGDGTIDLVVTRQDSDQVIYALRQRVRFPDRLTEVRILFQVNACSFPAAGVYQFSLLVDEQWLAHRRLHIVLKEDQT